MAATLNADEVARLYRVSTARVYELSRMDPCPIPGIVRLGRTVRFSTAAIREALRMTPEDLQKALEAEA